MLSGSLLTTDGGRHRITRIQADLHRGHWRRFPANTTILLGLHRFDLQLCDRIWCHGGRSRGLTLTLFVLVVFMLLTAADDPTIAADMMSLLVLFLFPLLFVLLFLFVLLVDNVRGHGGGRRG